MQMLCIRNCVWGNLIWIPMASKLISRRMISVCATDPRQPLTFYSNASSTKKKGKVFSPIFQSTFHVFTHFLKAKSLTLFFLGLIYPMLSLINEIFRDFPIKDFGDPPLGVGDISLKNYRKPINWHFRNYRQLIDIEKWKFWNYRKIIDIAKCIKF